MKNKSAPQLLLLCVFTVLAFAVCNLPAQVGATSTNWIDTTSNWFTDANWNNHVPTTSTDAFIDNAGTAQINSQTGNAKSLTLGSNQQNSGTVSVDGTNGGRLVVPDACADQIGIFPGLLSVGYSGTGTLLITNGGTVSSVWGYIAATANATVPTSNGSVTVDGTGSIWTISSSCGSAARLFVGGSYNDQTGMDDSGGIALLTVKNGGTVKVDSPANQFSVKVGPSGTLTGNGTIINTANGSASRFTAVQGTLAPSGTLHIYSDLGMISTTTMVCNVTPQAADNVQVLSGATLGIAGLAGRLSVKMTGTFTPGTQFTLLHADGGLNNQKFDSVSISYAPIPTYTPVITYDAHNVYLYLRPN
jgi:T5SS/PEP-CTERM-associated repeat protein